MMQQENQAAEVGGIVAMAGAFSMDQVEDTEAFPWRCEG